MSRDLSFYNQQEIDLAAKSIYPLVERYIDSGKTLDKDFIDQYYTNVIQSLGDKLDSLNSKLGVSGIIFADENLATASHGIFNELGLRSVYDSNLEEGDSIEDAVLARHTYLNGIVLARKSSYQDLMPLLDDTEELAIFYDEEIESCSFTRKSGATLFVIVTERRDLTTKKIITYLSNSEPCFYAQVLTIKWSYIIETTAYFFYLTDQS